MQQHCMALQSPKARALPRINKLPLRKSSKTCLFLPEPELTLPAASAFSKLTDEVITQIFLSLHLRDILRVRQTCRAFSTKTRSRTLWNVIGLRLLPHAKADWPSWGFSLQDMPIKTIETIVLRFEYLASRKLSTTTLDEASPLTGLIIRDRASLVWLHLIRARWLLVQLKDCTLELWDLDQMEFGRPHAACGGLEGFVDGFVYQGLTTTVEMTISTRSSRVYQFILDLPFKSDPQPASPRLTIHSQFEGYNSLKCRCESEPLLAFAANDIRACVVHEPSLSEVELAIGAGHAEIQKTFDIFIRNDITCVVRHRNIDLYRTTDVKAALSRSRRTTIQPFESIPYMTPSVPHAQIHKGTPPYIDPLEDAIHITSMCRATLAYYSLVPQAENPSGLRTEYRLTMRLITNFSRGVPFPLSMGARGHRFVAATYSTLGLHRATLDGNERSFPSLGERAITWWIIPDYAYDIPMKNCAAFDEDMGICVLGMASGRIWIGDPAPWARRDLRWSPLHKPAALPSPDHLYPIPPPSYYLFDKFYHGKASPEKDIVPAWSTAVDHYFPYRNDPHTYGSTPWFVSNVLQMPFLSLPRTVLFSTQVLGSGEIERSEEIFEVDGQLYFLRANEDLVPFVQKIAEGTTLQDLIDDLGKGLWRGIPQDGLTAVSDWVAHQQLWTWYGLAYPDRDFIEDD